MSRIFQHRRRVEFRDTDMAGIVHFSVFFTYMEEAEHEFLRSIELGVFSEFDGQHISWPRVAAKCEYRSAIQFEDLLDINLSISRLGEKSITYDHKIHCGQTIVAVGSVTAVCCRMIADQKPESIVIPQKFLDQLQPYVAKQPK